ncbi:MAG: BREX-1 system adenine-specific DNA-methyltransferase PglX [Acidobacteria bacterium]|nr:BREX-1 system adenine-specific DNA-methyltransferase PglX [Acidobacteriota bacterium]
MDNSPIHEMSLEARHLLMAEIREQLEGIYGLSVDGRFEPIDRLPVVLSMDAARRTRERLEKFFNDEAAAGLKGAEAVAKLTKEVAFTHLNRLVAFKMLEARKLVRGTIDRHHDSGAFKFYLVEEAHAPELALYEAGDMPQDAFGEGPRDRAYRHFLLWQTGQLAEELKVLFDPNNLASHLFPRPRALRQLLGLLNQPALQEAWAVGNEETIGWVYQFFNEEEKAEVFDRLYRQKQKIRREDLPAATQIFTPRWIVKFLIENTLGRLWMEMHPDSTLAEKLEYLVPREAQTATGLKRACEIRVLDPACGTMHFGLVAFDLLVEMYREEFARAGQEGWPALASVEKEEEIPEAIVRHNLYGIDIDLRAVQLSALTLYLKAKTLNPKTQLVESRLACADIHMLNGSRLKDFLATAGIERPIYNRILSALNERLRYADQLGSLLRLDVEIRELVEQERRRYEREGRTPDLFGWSAQQFESEAGREEFWEMIEVQINQALDFFAQQQAKEGRDQSFFVGETTKGLRLLEVLGNRYAVVLANPPYMTSRNMNSVMSEYLKNKFPAAKRDLYAAFIQRCAELLADEGRMGLITQQSFMFISSYEALRKWLGERVAIETMAHTGPRAFAEVAGEKVNTTLYVLRREADETSRNEAVGTYFRLVKEPDAEAKQRRFERAVRALLAGEADATVYCYRQGDFAAIPGAPWVYWIMPNLRHLFQTLPKLGDSAQPRQGLATADNFRFLRFWWEVGKQKIGFDCTSQEDCQSRPEKWFPHMKGGSFSKWYGNQEYCINYGRNGYELKAWAAPLYNNSGWSRIIKSPDFYFQRGVTWTDLTSGRFSARLSPGGFVFDVSGSSAFPDEIPLVLGVMNSTFAQYALKLINPTAHVQVGDLARLPIPKTSSSTLGELVEQAIALAKVDSEEDETTFDFIAPAWRESLAETPNALLEHCARLAAIEREIDEEVYRLYGISEEDRKAIESELSAVGEQSSENGEVSDEDEVNTDDAETEPLSADDSQLTIALARCWIFYAVGVVLNRFQPGIDGALGRGRFDPEVAAALRRLADRDGIATFDEHHEDDLARKVEQALELMLGEAATGEIINAVIGETGEPATVRLRRYLERDFFKFHVQQYRKRPIYWLLQSPRKSYSLLLFHERVTPDTLPLVQGTRYVGGKLNHLTDQIKSTREAMTAAAGRERKQLEQKLERLEDARNDLENFNQHIQAVLQLKNERGETVGWSPKIDDGVILNLAPLYELLPSWKAEPKKYWGLLQAGKYDWAATARRYWPDRVTTKCKTNKSYAIAHGFYETPEKQA